MCLDALMDLLLLLVYLCEEVLYIYIYIYIHRIVSGIFQYINIVMLSVFEGWDAVGTDCVEDGGLLQSWRGCVDA